MFANNDPQYVAFCNTKVRVVADEFVSSYWTAKHLLALIEAEGLVALIPNTADLVEDGSAIDGRSPISGAQIQGLFTAAQSVVSFAEANSSEVLNLMLAVSVNGQAAF